MKALALRRAAFPSVALSGVRWLALLGLFLIPLAGLSSYLLFVATLTLVNMIAALGLNLVLGYAGQISLAQAAFMGIGAYTVGIMNDAPYLLAMAVAAALGLVVGFLLGLPSLRVRHHYLAMVTLGFNIFFFFFIINEEWLTGGALGFAGVTRPALGPFDFTSDTAYHVLVAVVTVLVAFTAHWVLNSQWGRAFKAIRENELRAKSVGIKVHLYKTYAFAIGSAFACIAGGLLAPLLSFIDPLGFTILVSFQVLIMVVIGGLGRFEGAFFGAALVTMLPELLRATQSLSLIIFGVIGLAVLLFFPKGAVGAYDAFFLNVLRRTPPALTK